MHMSRNVANAIKELSDIPSGGFIPQHLKKWASISTYMPDVPAVKLDLSQNGGLSGQIIIDKIIRVEGDDEQRYYSDALFLKQNDGVEICLFDSSKHGWDAVQCDYHFKQETEKIHVKCVSCGAEKFQPRISWLGYQVFDGEPPTTKGSLEFRDSFDSISIDIHCLSCKETETILTAETA